MSEQVVSVYRSHGARLVEAHGYTTEKTKKVPEDTVIMFLTKPGLCMLQAAGRSVSRTFFENRKGLEDFFNSGGPKHRGFKHVSDILERTHLPGGTYQDVMLEMRDPTSKGVGYVKKLPLTRREFVVPGYYEIESAPTFAETAGPVVYGKHILLSSLVRKTGPGVYIVSACRVAKSNLGKANKKPMNTPHPSGWPYIKPVATARRFRRILKERPAKPGLKKVLTVPRPGATNALLRMEMASLKKYSMPKSLEAKVKNVVNHMTRNFPVTVKNIVTRKRMNGVVNLASNKNLKKYIAPLPANTNVNKLRFTLGVLSNKNTLGSFFRMLPAREKVWFLTHPSQRGQIVYLRA